LTTVRASTLAEPEVTELKQSEEAGEVSIVIDEGFLLEQAGKSWDPDGPGAVLVAVFGPDGATVHAAVGTDPNGTPPSLEDVFRVGSITKTFTAITVLSLVDDGIVDLDSPVADYVTRFDIDADITVRNVLQHTGGIDDPIGFLTAIADDRSRVWTPEEVLAGTRLDDLEPSASHSYANVNYTILGVLIEEVTGQQYHEVVRQRLLEPLAMDSTYLAFHEQGAEVFSGYYDAFGENGFTGSPEPIDFDFTSTVTHAWASGAMVSTARDLHVMMSALFAGEILSAPLVDEMTPVEGYGLGILVPDFTSATPLFGHDGRVSGSGTWLIHAPETAATVFVVSNGDHLLVSPATRSVAEAIGNPDSTIADG
jgi:D-alanyl-D-alanine carboxypeptidase